MHHEDMNEAKAGDNIGFNVRGVEKKDIARGDVLGHVSKTSSCSEEFIARIVV